MPSLLIHMGTNKTGTTHIQHFCADQTAALRARGIVYPDVGQLGSTHHPIALGLKGDNTGRFGTGEPYGPMLDRLAEEARHAETVILSSEVFRTIDPIHAERLKALFSGFDQVSLLFYIRRQDSYAVSFWGSLIKFRMRREVPTFDEFCHTEDLDFLADLERWETHADGARVIVRPFVPGAWKNGSLLDDFFQFVDGEPAPLAQSALARNESLPVQSLDLLRTINRLEVPYRHRLVEKVGEISARFPVAEGEGLLTHDLQRYLLDRYANRNRSLSERYWTEEEQRLFDEQEVPSYDKPYRGLTMQEYASIIAELWAQPIE